MIALALACNPSLVIADEPTTALDVVMQAQVLQLLERLRERLGLALILITHDLGVLAETCDRIAVMYAGRIVEIGPVDTVFSIPQHPYTKRLLETMPSIGGSRGLADPIPGGPPDPGEPPPGCRFRPRCPYAQEHLRARGPGAAGGRARRRRPLATSRPGPSGPRRASRRHGRRARPDDRFARRGSRPRGHVQGGPRHGACGRRGLARLAQGRGARRGRRVGLRKVDACEGDAPHRRARRPARSCSTAPRRTGRRAIPRSAGASR